MCIRDRIHRIIKDKLRGRLEREGKTEHYKEILEDVARQSSVCERRADEAERESDKLKKAEYMSYHIGEEFEGIISGVTAVSYTHLDVYKRQPKISPSEILRFR